MVGWQRLSSIWISRESGGYVKLGKCGWNVLVARYRRCVEGGRRIRRFRYVDGFGEVVVVYGVGIMSVLEGAIAVLGLVVWMGVEVGSHFVAQ